MWKVATGVIVAVPLSASVANAQFLRQEVIAFDSAMMPAGDFLTGQKGTPITLAGYLRLPKSNEKNSVVVLFHGVSGLYSAAASPLKSTSSVIRNVRDIALPGPRLADSER
jgi:hypothetical protein